MSTKPKYVQELEHEMQQLKLSLKETKDNQDNILTSVGDALHKLNEIHICLAGTEFDKENENGKGGGVVRRLGRVERKCDSFQEWKTQTKTRDAVVWVVIGSVLTAIWTVLIKSWDKLFG